MGNKPKHLKPTDESVRTAEHLMQAGRAELEPEVKKLKSDLEKSEQLHLATGQHQAFRAMALLNDYLAMKAIADVITNKSFRMIPGVKTVGDYCKKYGIPHTTAYENVRITRALTAEEYGLFNKIGLTRQTFLDYASLSEDQRLQIKEGKFGNLEKAGREEIQVIIQDLLAEKNKKEEALKTAKGQLRDKDTLLEKKNKEIDRYTGKANAMGMTPEEDAFVSFLDEHQRRFDGFVIPVEPDKCPALSSYGKRDEDGAKLPSNVTPRMRARYLEFWGYLLKQVIAYQNTADEMFGGGNMVNKDETPEWMSKEWHQKNKA